MAKSQSSKPLKRWLTASSDCRERRFVQIGSALPFDKRFTSLSVGARYFYIICRVFVAFSGQFSAYKNRKAHDLRRVFNGQS